MGTRIILLGFFCLLFVAPAPALAQSEDLLGLEYGRESGLENRDVRITAVQIINVALSLLGIIFLALIVYAGFKWMTAAGNTDTISSAKSTITAAVIGLLVVLAAYSITNFVLFSANRATTGFDYGTRR